MSYYKSIIILIIIIIALDTAPYTNITQTHKCMLYQKRPTSEQVRLQGFRKTRWTNRQVTQFDRSTHSNSYFHLSKYFIRGYTMLTGCRSERGRECCVGEFPTLDNLLVGSNLWGALCIRAWTSESRRVLKSFIPRCLCPCIVSLPAFHLEWSI